ncbi:putative nucleic acid-binding, replication factor A [Helianthus anomalus]
MSRSNNFVIKGQSFNCKASITAYIKGRPWYYTMCPQCPRKIIQTERSWSCRSHQNLPEPKFMYCVTATIADNTAPTTTTIADNTTPTTATIADNTTPTTATFFDEATIGLIGIQCREMILQHGFADRNETPEPLYQAIGKEVTMHVQYARASTTNSSLLSVNKVFKNTLNITGTPSSPTQQTTPTTNKKLASESTENRPSAKRQLYQSGIPPNSNY